MTLAQLSWICAKAGKKRDETRKRSISQLPRLLHAVEGLIHIPISRSTHLMPSITIKAEEKNKLAVAVRQRRKEPSSTVLAIPDAKAVMSFAVL